MGMYKYILINPKLPLSLSDKKTDCNGNNYNFYNNDNNNNYNHFIKYIILHILNNTHACCVLSHAHV